MNQKLIYGSNSAKKKKTVIIASVLGVVILLIGAFFLGRISVKNKPVKKKESLLNDSQEIQNLKSELNSVKNQLNQSNVGQKSQLESKLSNIENKIKILSNQDKTTIQELEREIKEIKEEIKNDKPGDSPSPHTPPTDKNQLQFTVRYFVELGRNHMWIVNDSDKTVLIDKENSIFPNNELTKKGANYTITFLPQDAEKFHNQSHVYYFSKNNSKFTLKKFEPQQPPTETEVKVKLTGEALNEQGEFAYYCFGRFSKSGEPSLFYVDKNHPRIKELLKEGKLIRGKHFIIRYGKIDKNELNFSYDFNEDNRELEITEA